MTERKRATGFVLMDAAFLSDAKFLRLHLRAKSPHDFAAAVGVFWMLLGDARRAKSPDLDWEDYEDYAAEIAQLRDARLLKEEGFDPEVFERWAPAYRSVPNRTLPYPSVPGDTGHFEHGPYPSVPDGTAGTKSTLASGQVSSSQVPSTNVNGNARETAQSFMRMKPSPAQLEALRAENQRILDDPKASPGAKRAATYALAKVLAPSSEKGTP